MGAKTILTGIKPTGTPHVGNLVGAIRPALKLAETAENRCLYFIADYHALTTIHDAKELRQLTREVAATWLALGLDPARVTLYRQSDVPEVFELAWILSCFAEKGLLNRAHAYKAKVAENEAAGSNPDAGVSMGLYAYPVLMAADILLFDTDLVPVGEDQVQHIEIARDIAGKLNHAYGKPVVKAPRAMIQESAAIVPGLDGRKMSKSYQNTIPLFLEPKALRKLVMRIQTDSSRPEDPKDPDASSLFTLYRHFAAPAEREAMRERYLKGIGWGEAKEALFEKLDAALSAPRARYAELMSDSARLDSLLTEGAARARGIAGPVLARIRSAIGIA